VNVGPALAFSPNAITIAKNTTVTWEWQGTTPAHNVTFDNTPGRPTNIANRTSGSESRTFDTAGIFDYQCTNHAGMTGRVTVTP
jgi:plastocyanin